MPHVYKPLLNLKGIDLNNRLEVVNAVWAQADDLECELPDVAWSLSKATDDQFIDAVKEHFNISQ